MGSSSSSRLCRPATSWASASLVFSPPESVAASWNAFSPREPEHAEQRAAARRHRGRTPRAGGRARCARPRCPRAPGRSSRATRACPSATSPRSGSSRPASALSSVVLPAPLRPITSRRSPATDVEADVAKTSSGPNDFHSSVAVSTVRPRGAGLGKRSVSARRGVGRVDPLAARCARPGCRGSWPTRARLAVWPASSRRATRGVRSRRPGGRRRLREPLLVAIAGGEVLRVRALVLDERAGRVLGLAVEVDDARDGVVEQVEVVAHDDAARRGSCAGSLSSHVAGVGVEVVGGLVEQEQVAAARRGCGRARAGAARRPTARRAGGRAGRRRGRRRRRARRTSDSAA